MRGAKMRDTCTNHSGGRVVRVTRITHGGSASAAARAQHSQGDMPVLPVETCARGNTAPLDDPEPTTSSMESGHKYLTKPSLRRKAPAPRR